MLCGKSVLMVFSKEISKKSNLILSFDNLTSCILIFMSHKKGENPMLLLIDIGECYGRDPPSRTRAHPRARSEDISALARNMRACTFTRRMHQGRALGHMHNARALAHAHNACTNVPAQCVHPLPRRAPRRAPRPHAAHRGPLPRTLPHAHETLCVPKTPLLTSCAYRTPLPTSCAQQTPIPP